MSETRKFLSTISCAYDGAYLGLATPDGNQTAYMRTTEYGFIPYQGGNAGSGHSNLGTSSWHFAHSYIDKMYGVPIVENQPGFPDAALFFQKYASNRADAPLIAAAYADQNTYSMTLYPGGSNRYGISIEMLTGASLRPTVDGFLTLGTSSYKWKQVYAQTSAISTSDRTKKKDIKPMPDDLTQKFILGLAAMIYKLIDGESGRTHWGFIAQDVEELMNSIGMTSKDFAGFIKSPKMEEYEEEIESEESYEDEMTGETKTRTVIKKVKRQREIPGEFEYGLRYEEFIAPTIKMVQMEHERVDDKQRQIDELKAENKMLKEKLNMIMERLGME